MCNRFKTTQPYSQTKIPCCGRLPVRELKAKGVIMDLIETLHLRAFSGETKEKATMAFHQLNWPQWDTELKEILLLREVHVAGDLCFILRWQRRRISEKVKSPLALELASAFSEYGQIHHSVWIEEHGVSLKKRGRWS
jgi:hypothetical protein